jgi:hypothetical protein
MYMIAMVNDIRNGGIESLLIPASKPNDILEEGFFDEREHLHHPGKCIAPGAF